MATSTQLNRHKVVVRVGGEDFADLSNLVFSRYPDQEWATFAHFGWRAIDDVLVLTLARLDPPHGDEVDRTVGHVAITEPYTLRMALAAEQHPLAIGVVHSHPEECPPLASVIDDDMDGYYSTYFASFAPGRPYVSLIASVVGGKTVLGGRVHWQGEWHPVDHFIVAGDPQTRGFSRANPGGPAAANVQRLADAFGHEAAHLLSNSTVAVVGAGGTGSAAIEALARAGVGHLVIVDPDVLEPSNLERVHGSTNLHAELGVPKVELAKEHVLTINPACQVTGLIGSLPQEEVTDSLVQADVVIGCTDSQHSRLALSDLAFRYLVPALDCGVSLEGNAGAVSAQVIQFVRFLPEDACALCRGMVTPVRVSQELMSDEERATRRRAAQDADARREPRAGYWQEEAQLNTVGYLTTTAGAMLAGYAIGWLTGRFTPPFERLQMDMVAPDLAVVSWADPASDTCACQRVRGWADQAKADSLISPPSHWPPVKRV